MSAVNPLTVVTKVGRQELRPDGLAGNGSIQRRIAEGEMIWVHEDCVTLADAERYAREKVEEALENVRRFYSEEERKFPQNHGAFYLETQADLVLKARLDELEQAVTNRYEVSLRGMQSRLEQLSNRVKELERIELV